MFKDLSKIRVSKNEIYSRKDYNAE